MSNLRVLQVLLVLSVLPSSESLAEIFGHVGGDVDADLVDEGGHSDGEAVVPKINLKNVLIGRIDRVLNEKQ
jgi:hypothetical protein